MRLALPPLERETARELTEPSLFDRGRGVGARTVQWVTATARVEEPGTLRGQAAAILAHVRATGAEPTAKLETRWGNARAAVKRLAELGPRPRRRSRRAGGPVLRRASDARRTSRRNAGADRRHRRAIGGALRDARRGDLPPSRRDRERQDRGLPPGDRRGARGVGAGRSSSCRRSRSRRSSSRASAPASATTSPSCTRA